MRRRDFISLIGGVAATWPLAARAQQQTGPGTTVVQMSYYAEPGKEREVLSIRLSACDVLEKNGVTRGRVLTRGDSARETQNTDNPAWYGRVSFPTRRA